MAELQLNWRQITAQRDVAGAAFDRGVIDFNWSIGRPFGMIWNKSYFRIAMTIKGAGGASAPELKENLAFADNPAAGLFTNCYARCGGMDVSSIVNYAPQAHQVKTRLSKTGAWLDNIGKNIFGMDADFASRQKRVSTNNVYLGPNPLTATIAIVAATGRVTGENTKLFTGESKLSIGDKIIGPDGTEYPVTTAATDDVGAACVVTPHPANDIAATIGFTKVGAATNTIYVHWQPPIGIFEHAKPMGSGDYRLQLNPNSYYKTALVQSLAAAVAGTNFEVEVNDVQFFLATINSNIPASGVEQLRLMECQVQSKSIATPASDNLLDFTIPPSTQAISVFIQHPTSGSDTQYPPTLFKSTLNADEGLRSIQVNYAGENKPSTRWNSESVVATSLVDGVDYTVQRYLDTQLYGGLFFSEGGSESYTQWKQRGGLYHFSWVRDASDRSTHCQVSVNFANAAPNTVVYVAAHYARAVNITTENGMVVDVASLAT